MGLDAGHVDVDAVRLERALGSDDHDGLESAVARYRGDLLAGLALDEPPFEEWLVAERERLRERALGGLARLLARQRATGTGRGPCPVPRPNSSVDGRAPYGQNLDQPGGVPMKVMPVSEVKAKLTRLVDEVAARDEQILITRNGRAQAVLLSEDEFDGWRETVEILADRAFVREIRRGLLTPRSRFKRYTVADLFSG